MTVTVLGPRGPRPPYGSFAGKAGAAGSKVFTRQFTVLSPRGPAPPYHSFLGKGASVQPAAKHVGWIGKRRHDPKELERRLKAQQGNVFGRKWFDEFLAATEAAIERAERTRSERHKQALYDAVNAASDAAANAIDGEFEPPSAVMLALNAAACASRVTASIRHAQAVAMLAMEENDDEEALMLLLH